MARKTVLVDDLNGKEADETIHFSVDGVSFEIDLTSENASVFREALAPWINAARIIRRQPRGRRNSDAAKIREWANNNGWNLGDRGRLPADAVDAYAGRV